MNRLGFIGIGAMGYHMSKRLLENNYDLYAYDNNPEALEKIKSEGAKTCESPAKIGEFCDVVITMLPNSSITKSVLFEEGVAGSLNKDAVIIDMSSSYALSTIRFADKLLERGIKLIDAPVSGGVIGAKKGTLTIMVGAEEQELSAIKPIFECMSKKIFYIGSVGSGHALKALNNYLSAASLYATSEVMLMVKQLGIPQGVAIEVLNESSGQSFSTKVKFPNYIIPETFDSNFALNLMYKDISMVKDLAEDLKLPFYLGDRVVDLYGHAVDSDLLLNDHTEIIKFIENQSKSILKGK